MRSEVAGSAPGRGRRQFGGFGGHVEADADDDRVAGRLGQDPAELGRAGQDVVRPFQPRLDAGHRGDRRGDGHPGEQREPAAAGGRHGRRRSSREKVSAARGGEIQVRPIRPRPARCSSAASTTPSGSPPRARASRSALVEPVRSTTSMSRHRPPGRRTARRRLAASRGLRSGGCLPRMVLGSHGNPLLFRKPGGGKSVTDLGTSQRRGADDGSAPDGDAGAGRRRTSGCGRRRSPGTPVRWPRGPGPSRPG